MLIVDRFDHEKPIPMALPVDELAHASGGNDRKDTHIALAVEADLVPSTGGMTELNLADVRSVLEPQRVSERHLWC